MPSRPGPPPRRAGSAAAELLRSASADMEIAAEHAVEVRARMERHGARYA
ncbi:MULTISPECIES: hypothetical protein [unclassified Micromonospora]